MAVSPVALSLCVLSKNNCFIYRVELKEDAREVDLELYCLRCHDKMGIPICGACRRPIEERVVHALGKTWHVEVCSVLGSLIG